MPVALGTEIRQTLLSICRNARLKDPMGKDVRVKEVLSSEDISIADAPCIAILPVAIPQDIPFTQDVRSRACVVEFILAVAMGRDVSDAQMRLEVLRDQLHIVIKNSINAALEVSDGGWTLNSVFTQEVIGPQLLGCLLQLSFETVEDFL